MCPISLIPVPQRVAHFVLSISLQEFLNITSDKEKLSISFNLENTVNLKKQLVVLPR